MCDRDPFKILGLSRDARQEEIKKSYRRLSKLFHPDFNPDDPGAEARFKEVQWAYETLSRDGLCTGTDRSASHAVSDYGAETNADHPFLGFFQLLRAYSRKNVKQAEQASTAVPDQDQAASKT